MQSERQTSNYYLHGIDFKVEILVLDKTVDALSQNTLEIALTRASAGVCRHHAGDRSIRPQKGTQLGSSLELSRKHGLEHGEEEMLLSALVLVAVEREHNRLEQGVDLG